MTSHEEDINASLVSPPGPPPSFQEWAALPVKPVEFDGWDHKTFHLGESMSVRLPSAERYSDQVYKEHRWLPRLARQLPLPIPVPLAMGVPAHDYPWHWSIYRWLEGKNAAVASIDDLSRLATTLARFLTALMQVDPAGGPAPGQHNFFRGGSLATYDGETRDAIPGPTGSDRLRRRDLGVGSSHQCNVGRHARLAPW